MTRMRAETVNNILQQMPRGARVLGHLIPFQDPTRKETQRKGTAPGVLQSRGAPALWIDTEQPF